MAEYYFETLPIHPPPNRLESLTGYLIRLAEANGSQSLALSDFLRQTFNINRKSIDSNRVTLLKDYCPTSFGSLPAVVHCSEALLRQTTFYHLGIKFGRPTTSSLLARSLGTSLRYCPLCLSDSEIAYRSLTWRFLILQGCDMHCCRLLDQCTHCGQKIPLIAIPLRTVICPTCSKDLSTCRIEPVPQHEKEKVETLSSDLDFLLSHHPLENTLTNFAEHIGQQFIKIRLKKQLKASDICEQLGMMPQALEIMETGRPQKQRYASFLTYVRYAEYLGIAWRELFDGILQSLEEQKLVRPQYRRAWPDEEEVVEQVQQAINRLHVIGRNVTLEAISQETKMAKAYLRRYPQVAGLLKEISDEIHVYNQQERREHRDKELLLNARDAIVQLELLGENVSIDSLSQKMGVSSRCLRRNPLIKDLVLESRERISTARKQREQEELTRKVQAAVQELEVCGQSVNKAAIAMKLGVREAYLDHKPYLAKFIDRSMIKVKRRQHREEELITRVKIAIEQLSAEGKSITYQAIEKVVGVARCNLRSYPQVKSLIVQCLCSSALKVSRSKKRREEGEVLAKIEATVEQFKALGQVITLPAICDEVNICLPTLKEFPRVSSLLDQCIDEYYQTLKRQTQIRGEKLKVKVEQVACELETRGEIVTAAAIAEILGIDDTTLAYYLPVEMFLQQYKKSNPRHLQKEEQLMGKAKAAILQLEAQGQPFSIKALCRVIGCTRDCLKEYPEVEVLVKQSIEDNRALRLQQMQRREVEEEERIKSAFRQLEAQGQPITLRAVSKIIDKSPKQLYHNPNIVDFIKNEVKTKSHEYRMRQRQMREEALVDLVLQAREQLQILGVPFSGKALATHIRISYSTLYLYPKVREMLNKFRQACSQPEKYEMKNKGSWTDMM